MAYAGLAALVLGVAFLSLYLVSRLDRRAVRPSLTEDIALLFEDGELVDATAPARDIIARLDPEAEPTWHLAYRALSARFPGLPETAEAAAGMAPRNLAAIDENDDARLSIEKQSGCLRIAVTDPAPPTLADRHFAIRQDRLLNRIIAASRRFPFPVWLQSEAGRIDWSNKAFRELLNASEQKTGEPENPLAINLQDSEDARTERRAVEVSDTGETQWFSVTTARADDGTCTSFAIGIDALIEAEIAQRKFVQTLTKTFAQLSTGLAIFDQNRQLALFNPALIDLLSLPADFLSGRPTLLTFFDRLRENRMMPEPKDYTTWRQQIAELVVASSDGRYQETWTLPSGLTYRVTGRPHPDGAIALLFEDISAEVSLTRRFRAQLNLGQAVLDGLDDAVAVFSPTGELSFSNQAFRKLWKIGPDSSFAGVSLRDALRQWTDLARPGAFWKRFLEYVADTEDRSEWFSDIEMRDGAAFDCRVAPLSGGATLVSFRLRPVLEAHAEPANETPPTV